MRPIVMVLVGMMLMADVPIAQQPQLPSRKILTLDLARRVAAGAEAEAKRNNWAVSIAVLDEAGHMMVFHRMDGAKLVATDIAVRKARTAVYFQGPTKALEEEVAGGRTALLPIDGFMPLEGGIPLIVDGILVGAIGVSGVTGSQDAQCAQAGVRALTPGFP
jgi:glc operon protein GlcG